MYHRPPLVPRRSVPLAAPNFIAVPPPNTQAILEAAQQLSAASTHAAHGHKRRRANKSSSQIIIIGPFPSQVLDLSSSSGSSAGSSTPLFALDDEPGLSGSSGIPGIPSPPITPTHVGGRGVPLLDSPPSAATDWVAYSTPLDDDDFVLEDDAAFSDTSSLHSEAPVFGPAEQAVLVPENQKPGPILDDSFAQMVLQSLRFRESPYHTPSECSSQSSQETPNRVIPLPFNAAWIRSSTSLVPIRPPNFSSFSRTYVDDYDDDDPQSPTEQVSAEAELFSDSKLVCGACDGREVRMFHLKPCEDLVCPTCFSSSIAAVSVTQGASKCPACMEPVASFEQYRPGQIVAVRGPRQRKRLDCDSNRSYETTGETIVMRIDNVAWDIEPRLVEKFLPPGTLPMGHPQPIHICMDRHDGRTKDYMYIEVASPAAAKKTLQTRQNSFMPGGKVTGGRKRAVTITQVTHRELLHELRPNSKGELDSLLELCEAVLTTPAPQLRIDSTGRGRLHASVGVNGKVHYLKYRHAPFHALISLMCKLSGTESPIYWDLFRIASGAISALANSLKCTRADVSEDRALLARLNRLFDRCFSTRSKV